MTTCGIHVGLVTGAMSVDVNDSQSINADNDDSAADNDLEADADAGTVVLGGYERQRLLGVGCGSLVAGASLVALITFATDRCHVCVRRRRRSFLSTPPAGRQTTRVPRAKPTLPHTVATPPADDQVCMCRLDFARRVSSLWSSASAETLLTNSSARRFYLLSAKSRGLCL